MAILRQSLLFKLLHNKIGFEGGRCDMKGLHMLNFNTQFGQRPSGELKGKLRMQISASFNTDINVWKTEMATGRNSIDN